MATTTARPGLPAVWPSPRAVREIVTPEGVPLRVTLASRAERFAAVLIDLALIFVAIAVLVVLIFVVVTGQDLDAASGWWSAVAILVSFALRSFYFVFFELLWQGTTPGKRLMRLRVIDRRGGPLRADAVFARNIMREVEIFLPLQALVMGTVVSSWGTLLAIVWTGVLALLPLFNRQRLRAGDIVAGTWVVEAPKAVLLPDVASAVAEPRPEAQGEAAASPYRFSAKQLGIYGIYELQTLEDVLRRGDREADEVRRAVAERIQKKINWMGSVPAEESRTFLEAFYAALRAHLEQRMLLGVRRESKHDPDGRGPREPTAGRREEA